MKLILPEHKNLIFNICKDTNLEIDKFEFKRIEYLFRSYSSKYMSDSIEYKINEYTFYFRLREYNDGYDVKIYPGLEKRKYINIFKLLFSSPKESTLIEYVESFYKNKWDDVLYLIKAWLHRIMDNQKDLFEIYKDISNNIPLLHLQIDFDNSLFSAPEVEMISNRLELLKNEVSVQFDLTENEINDLKSQIEFLKSQLKTQDRTSFNHIFHNTLVTIFVNYATDPNKFKKLLHLAKDVFNIGLNLIK